MILYDLVCDNDHAFNSWFRNSAAADKVLKARQSPCPACGSTKVRKAPMAPRLAKGGTDGGSESREVAVRDAVPAAVERPGDAMTAAMEKATQALNELRATIEKTFDHVGEKFPEEARRIHYGEAPERPIYGDATLEEARAMVDEGIKVAAIPWPKRRN